MSSKTILLLCFVYFVIHCACGQGDKKFFRKDYKYFKDMQSLYKLHNLEKTWAEAKKICELEDATFFYPENTLEAATIISWWNATNPLNNIFIGVSKMVSDDIDAFETIDGTSIADMYNYWAPGEPNNYANEEDCVVILRDTGALNDVPCGYNYPFICKKSLVSIKWNELCNSPKLEGQRDKKFFRKDYMYFEDTQSFYKIHNEHKTWADAKKICELEGATFFYPDSTQASFISWWTSTQRFNDFYIGVSSLVAKEVFETIDGRSIFDVYNKWGRGEPDDYQDQEDCVVIMRNTGTLYDVKCTSKYPFICKKTSASLEWNHQCNSPNLDYHYDEEFNRCYKFHTTPLPWPEAHYVCAAEQSYLAVPNSQREADLLVNITASILKDRVKEPYLSGSVHLGFHNRMGDGWQTFRGSSLCDSGYTKWALSELDGEDREQCGSMFYNGTHNDIDCKTRSFFICEHEIDILITSNDDKFGVETVAVNV